MLDSENQIITILDQAERNLREVIAEAATEGDYHSVDVARLAALEMDRLRKRVKGTPPEEESQVPQPSTRTTKKRRSLKSAYPRFEVRNGTLMRIGWSKKKKREYTHKAPKTVFEQTIIAMVALSQIGNGLVTAEEIIERVTNHSSEHIPSYQIYTVLGLLQDRDCIQRVGREGYRWSEQLEDNSRKVWAEYEGEIRG